MSHAKDSKSPSNILFGRWGDRVYEGLGHLGGALLALMTGAVVLQVILRRFFAVSIDGIDEVPRYAFVWAVMIGAASAMHRGEHTALMYFQEKLSGARYALDRIVVEALGILLFVSIIKVSFILIPNSQMQTSPGLGLPFGYVYAAMPVGAILIILPMAWRLGLAVRELWVTPWQRHS